MDTVTMHKRAVEYANRETFAKFNEYGPYKPVTEEHKFWLAAYDRGLLKA